MKKTCLFARRSRTAALGLTLALTMLLTACGSNAGGAAAGSANPDLPEGACLVELAGNATTGYQWFAEDYDESVMSVKELEYKTDDPSGSMAGAGGTFRFSVEPQKDAAAGDYVIAFYYYQEWEGVNKAAQYALVEVNVSDKGTLTVSAPEISELTPNIFNVEYGNERQSAYADDGALLYDMFFLQPKVTSEDHPAAADAINAYMAQAKDGFFASRENYDKIASENYQAWKENQSDGDVWNNGLTKENPASEDQISDMLIMDDFLLMYGQDDFASFLVSHSEFLGGADGSSLTYGITFDAESGELVGLQNIFNPELLPNAVDYIAGCVQKELETNYKDSLQKDYMDYVDAFAQQDGGSQWYLSDEGFVAVVQEGTACTKACGSISVTVPFEDLTGYR